MDENELDVNAGHISMLRYFWDEYRDIERYCDFEKIKPMLEKEYPYMLKAWYSYKDSIRLFDMELRNC